MRENAKVQYLYKAPKFAQLIPMAILRVGMMALHYWMEIHLADYLAPLYLLEYLKQLENQTMLVWSRHKEHYLVANWDQMTEIQNDLVDYSTLAL